MGGGAGGGLVTSCLYPTDSLNSRMSASYTLYLTLNPTPSETLLGAGFRAFRVLMKLLSVFRIFGFRV